MKSAWSDVAKGDHVLMGGRVLEVMKVKPVKSGKKIDVTLRGKGVPIQTGRVTATDKVKIPSLHDIDDDRRQDRQARWAKRSEVEATERREGLPAGDATVTKRPERAAGGPWDAPKGKAERILEDVLGATLVGEATDESAGYYVPPVDFSTVASHLMLFHGVLGNEYDTPMDAMAIHDQHHRDTKTGAAMKVNHWHTKERP